MDLSDFEVDRNRRSDFTGKRDKISVSISGGRTSPAIERKEGFSLQQKRRRG